MRKLTGMATAVFLLFGLSACIQQTAPEQQTAPDEEEKQDASNIQASILTAGRVVTETIPTEEIPQDWSTFEDSEKLGLKFKYPASWGDALYQAHPENELLGNIRFSAAPDYNMFVSTGTYQWTEPNQWKYPAFREIKCNEVRADTICAMINLDSQTIGKDTRFSYLEDNQRGGYEQVVYFMNPNSGYRFALFSREFGEYVQGTLEEQLDLLEKFRTYQLDSSWANEARQLNTMMLSIEYI